MQRAEQFRLLGDEDRLVLLALCAEEELSVSELAAIVHDSQPQTTKKTQPLRDAGLLLSRRDGARTLLRARAVGDDAVLAAALAEGRALAHKSGALARVPQIVAQREESSRRFFEAGQSAQPGGEGAGPVVVDELLPFLPLLSVLLPSHRLAVDYGTGDGALVPLLAGVFDRVIALDRSAARLAQCAARLAALGVHNVRLREVGEQVDATLLQEVRDKGGADVVLVARVLHHAARPADVLRDAAALLSPSGKLIVLDYLPHDDERMRDQRGDVWLGFSEDKLRQLVDDAGLDVAHHQPFSPSGRLDERAPDHHLPWQLLLAAPRRSRT